MRIPLVLLLALFGCVLVCNAEPTRPNFVFIAIDDLNDFAGYVAEEPGNFLQVIYPDAEVRAEVTQNLTPNLDKLARRSAPFVRAYCPSALCGPSRTSLMTGVLPSRSGYYGHTQHFRTYGSLKDAVTLPQQLKNSGYFTTGLGKLFHKPTGTVTGPIKNDWADAQNSWSVWLNHATGCNGGMPGKYSPPNGGNMVFGPSRLTLKESGDWLAADVAAKLLEHGGAEMTAGGRRGKVGPSGVKLPSDRPFFLGCGLFRPHLPFHAPSEFFDRFPTDQMTGLNRDTLDSISSDLEDLPAGAERFTDWKNGKMRVIMDHAQSLGADEEVPAWRAMVQSYLACVSFADACLGRLLEGYEKSPQRDNTVLFLWSDHGYHLGSKYHVAKQALWEEANRVQLIVHDPRKPQSCDGKLRRQIVSLNDLYPTICELAQTEVGPQVEVGRSLASLIEDVNAEPIHDHLLMTYQEGNHSLRTATDKLNRYADGSFELYDMIQDPSQRDNLANKEELKERLESLNQTLSEELGNQVLTNGASNDRPNKTLQDIGVPGLEYSGTVDWDETQGVVTFLASGSMPASREGFFWTVPSAIKKVVIHSGVTVQGGFRVPYRADDNPLFIEGRDRKTSVIEGTRQRRWTADAGIAESDKWRFSAISVVADAKVFVRNLTSRNPRGYHISGYANASQIHVDGCDLIDTRGGDNNNSDGFIGSAGSSIRNSFISTCDDAIKVYHDITIENVIIEQHRNGAPLQFGWSDENDTANATITNLTIRGVAPGNSYNSAPLTWVSGQSGIRNVQVNELTIELTGEIYDPTSDQWKPLGLTAINAPGCTLNLTVTDANIGTLPPGFSNAKGVIRFKSSEDERRR